MKKAAIVFGKILLGILTFILCIALMVSTIVTIVMADAHILTDKDNINTLITEFLKPSASVQLEEEVLPLNADSGPVVQSLSHASSAEIGVVGSSGFMVDMIYDMIRQEAGGELPFTKEQVENFVEESTLSDFLAEKGAGLVSDLITGEKTTTITVDEIKEQLEQNAQLIEDTFQIPMDEEFISGLTDSIEQAGVLDQINEGGLESILAAGDADQSPDAEGEEVENVQIPITLEAVLSGKVDVSALSLPQMLELFRSIASAAVLLSCVGACAVIMGLIFLTQWKKYYRAMIFIGITLFITGLICMIPAIVVWNVPEVVTELLGELAVGMVFVSKVVDMTSPVSVGVTAFGFVLIVAGSVLAVLTNKWAKEKLAAAAPVDVPAEEIPAEQ